MLTPGVLIVDDEIKLCRNIALKLKREGFTAYEAYDGKSAIRKLQKFPIRVVVLDYMLTDMTGLEVLKQIKEISPWTKVFMLTAYGNVENAVLAMKRGASDYLNKPIDLRQLTEIVTAAYHSLDDISGEVIFKSPKMQAVREILERITTTDAPVLLLGENGTGKTTLAKWIHSRSRRSDQPFLTVDCSTMPEAMLKRELFGASGKFAAADGGTLVLDEIGTIAPLIQTQLLQLIDEKRMVTLDTDAVKAINVRLITSTSQPLKPMAQEGRFLADLYYRLSLVEVEMPPLRDRKEDIPLLIEQKLAHLNAKYGKPLTVSEELIQMLIRLPWQGNISELMHLIERMHLLKLHGVLDVEDIPDTLARSFSKTLNDAHLQGRLYDVLEGVEGRLIVDALEKTGGNQSKAAELLGISRNALIYKMKRIGR